MKFLTRLLVFVGLLAGAATPAAANPFTDSFAGLSAASHTADVSGTAWAGARLEKVAFVGPRRALLAGQRGPAYLANFLSGTLPSGVTVSSSSLGALVTDATGTLTYKPNNLLTYSNTFSNAAWSKGVGSIVQGALDPLGGTSAWTVTDSATNQVQQVFSGGIFDKTQNTIIDIHAKAGSAGFIGISTAGNTGSPYAVFNLSTGQVLAYSASSYATITPESNGWYLISIRVPAGISANNVFQFQMGTTQAQATPGTAYAGTGSTIYVYAATASQVTYETTPRPQDQVITGASAYYGPAFDHDSAGNPLGLRIWESRTNLALYSRDYTQSAWTKANFTISANAATAPDGTVSADGFVETAVTTTYQIYNATGYSLSSATTASFYVKYVARQYVYLSLGTAGVTAGAVFDLVNGTVKITDTGYSASIVPEGGGWYRINVTINSASGTYYASLKSCDSVGYTNVTGVNGTAFYAWQSDVVVASFAGPPIPTGSAAVTAAADVVTLSGTPLALLQGSAGTAFVETTNLLSSITSLNILGSDNINQIQATADNAPRSYNGTNAFNGNTFTGSYSTGTVRTGLSWNASTRSIVANGAAPVSNTGSANFSANIYLGSNNGTSHFADGVFGKLAIYNSQLANGAFQAKSVVGAPF